MFSTKCCVSFSHYDLYFFATGLSSSSLFALSKLLSSPEAADDIITVVSEMTFSVDLSFCG